MLKLLWKTEHSTAREIVEQLYPNETSSDVGTVHSMLQRLEGKGLIDRDRSRWPHRFFALVTQGEVAGNELESLADKLSDGSMLPFLTHLGSRKLSDEELQQLRKLVNQHRRNAKGS